MMKTHLPLALFLSAALLATLSCSKELAIETEETTQETATASAAGDNTLTVKTRSVSTVDGVTSTVSLPVHVYVFSDAGKCVGLQTISTSDGEVGFKFKKGGYTVYAVAGASADAYSLPSQSEAAVNSPISLKEGMSEGELMVGGAAVGLKDGADNTVTLAMKRKVMQVERITIDNVPSSVTAVAVTLAPLYSGLTLGGSYTAETGSCTVNLTKTSEGTWQSAAPQYMFGASGEATITVQMTTGNVTRSYAYFSNDELNANYKVSISGSYNSNEFDLSGTITGEEWAGTKDISFTFAEEEESDTTKTPDTPVDPDDPLIGTLHSTKKGFYVSCTVNGDGTKTYLLMSTTALSTDKSSEPTQEEAASLIKTKINSLSDIKASTGWRLPLREELLAFKAIKSKYPSSAGTFTYGSSTAYYYQKEDGTIAALKIQGETDKTPMKNLIYIRAFTTITVDAE